MDRAVFALAFAIEMRSGVLGDMGDQKYCDGGMAESQHALNNGAFATVRPQLGGLG